MDNQEFKDKFAETLDTMYKIMEAKNADYGWWNPFWNFELIEKMWVTSLEKWILVRMTDKMSRIANLIESDPKVKDEAITDTLQDLANYSIILKLYLENKNTINW